MGNAGPIMSAPRALLFDLDGTLVDNSGVGSAVRRTCAALAKTLPFNQDEIAAANAAIFGSYFPSVESDWALGRLSGAAVEQETWRRTLQLLDCQDERIIGFAAETFSEAIRCAVRMYPDARRLLSMLPSSMVIGVVTNGAADSQWQKLRAIGMVDHLDVVVISAELGIAKPDPRIFSEALSSLNVEPTLAWHVGDSRTKDVAGANSAGLTSVWIDRSGRGHQPDEVQAAFEVDTLDAVAMLWRNPS